MSGASTSSGGAKDPFAEVIPFAEMLKAQGQ